MKIIFAVFAALCLALSAALLYIERERINWNCFGAGVTFVVGVLYAIAKPLVPGKTYLMGTDGLVEIPPAV